MIVSEENRMVDQNHRFTKRMPFFGAQLKSDKIIWRSGHTTAAEISAVAKSGPPKPSWSPMAAARAVTVAE